MTDAMHKTNKACLSQGLGGNRVLQEQWLFHTWQENVSLGCPCPTQPATLAPPCTSAS